MKSKIYNNKIYLLFATSTVWPFFALVWSAFFYIQNRRNLGLVIGSCLFLFAYLNSSKIPSADLLIYQERFLLAANKSLLEYINIDYGRGARDIMFYLFTWIIYNIFFGSFVIYKFIISYIIFGFKLLWLERSGFRKLESLLLVFLILVCLGPLTSLSLHLVRQEMAIAITLYGLSLYREKKLMSLFILFMALNTHLISIIILIAWFLSHLVMTLRFSVKSIAYQLISLTALYLLFLNITILNFGFFKSGLARLNDMESLVEYNSGISQIVIVTFLFIFLISFLKNYSNKQNEIDFIKLRHMMMGVILLLITLFLDNFELIQYRIFFITYTLLPICTPKILFKTVKKRELIFLYLIFSIIIFLYFLTNSRWTYDFSLKSFLPILL